MSEEVLKAILELRDTSSLNEKKDILANYATDNLKNVLKYTYDPFIQFYVRGDNALLTQKINSKTNYNKDLNFQNLFSALNKLSNRIVTGHSAINLIFSVIEEVSEEEEDLVVSILNKDLRCGISSKTINKVFPKLCKEFSLMLCNSLNLANSKKIDMEKLKKLPYPVRVDVKQDGIRAVYSQGVLKTRNGNEIEGYEHIIEICKKMCEDNPARILEGELKASTLKATMQQLNRIKNKDTSNFVYVLFDKLEHMKDKTTLFNRQDSLRELVKKTNHPNIIANPYIECNNPNEVIKYFNEQNEKGEEGVVVKINAEYEFKRSNNWLKMKMFLSEDLPIIGYEEGNGRNKNRLGAFLVSYNGTTINVGSGYSDEMREEYWQNRENLIGKIIEVSFKQLTEDGSFQFPTFVKLREDKDEKD